MRVSWRFSDLQKKIRLPKTDHSLPLTMQKTLIRKTWPRVRLVTINSERFYRVDARQRGTNGRQETFKSREMAEKRATEIEKNFVVNGVEALSFPAELRGM